MNDERTHTAGACDHGDTITCESMPGNPREFAGCRQLRRTQGTVVGLYDGIAAGMDTEGGRWQTLCEVHGHICSHDSLRLARLHAADPAGWCEECSAEATQCRKCGSQVGLDVAPDEFVSEERLCVFCVLGVEPGQEGEVAC